MKTDEEINKILVGIDDNNRKREAFDNILERRPIEDDDAINPPRKVGDEVWFRRAEDKEKDILASCASFIRQDGSVIVLSPKVPTPRWIEKYICTDGYVRMSTSRMLPSPEVEKQRKEVRERNDKKELEKAVESGAQGMSPAW